MSPIFRAEMQLRYDLDTTERQLRNSLIYIWETAERQLDLQLWDSLICNWKTAWFAAERQLICIRETVETWDFSVENRRVSAPSGRPDAWAAPDSWAALYSWVAPDSTSGFYAMQIRGKSASLVSSDIARFHRCLLCNAYPWKINIFRGLTKAGFHRW